MSTPSSSDRPIRVRIAPSPTGNLHVGTARAALFNYLFAKRHGGAFILRIEDTDQQRSETQYVQNIYDGLRAIGLDWDEGPDKGGDYGPYTQMERLAHYQKFADALLAAGLAYYTYETDDELSAQREAAKTAGKPYAYQKPAADLLAAMAKDPSRNKVLRFEVPANEPPIILNDLVRGEITFDPKLLGDFVIIKSDGTPTYNFAVVVDDVLMAISHIIRGEDHISNTPRQILLYKAFHKVGLAPAELPLFAHTGMILAPDRSKLSKRHGATAVSEFIDQGYLPPAFCNFLALLGWSPPDGQEVGSLDTFAQQFSLERLSQSPAIFEMDKLNWLNKQYIRQLPLPDFCALALPYLADYDLTQYDEEKLRMMLDAIREPITTLADIRNAVVYFFGTQVAYDAQTVGEVLMNEAGRSVLAAFESTFLPLARFESPEALAEDLKTFIGSLKPLKAKEIMWPIRVALSSRTQGADLSKTLYILGQETVKIRLEAAQRLALQPL